MKKTALLLMVAIATSPTYSVLAESNRNTMPPPGPYRSIDDVDQYALNKNDQYDLQLRERRRYFSAPSNQLSRDVPEWVQQRQNQMEQWLRQSNMQRPQIFNNQPPQWNYNQVTPRQDSYRGQTPNFQGGRMQQPFPPARGPIYGPGVPQQEFYQRPGYQVPRY